MKKLAIIGVLFLSLNSFGQDLVVENIDHNKVLYRGFENKLLFGRTDGNIEDFQMESINCEVSKLDGNENIYIIKTKSNSRRAKIKFLSNGKLIDSTSFVIQNLPNPSLFWGNQITGSDVSTSSEIEVKYPCSVTLKSSFNIVGWQCTVRDRNFNGQRNKLSQELLDFAKTMDKGEVISIAVKVKGEDGIIRKIGGSWIIG